MKQPLVPGEWKILVSGEEKGKIDSEMFGRAMISQAWDESQEWLKGEDLMQRIMLVEEESGSTISFV